MYTLIPKKTPLIALLLFCFLLNAQNQYEREYRIRKSQFPANALQFVKEEIDGIKHLKFYKKTDSAQMSFKAKFKKDKLWYGAGFTSKGYLEDIEILIKEIDIPEETFSAIKNYFASEFLKYRIKKIQQQYPVSQEENEKHTLKNAFQNLLLPFINYEFIIAGKKDKNHLEYEVLFNAQGKFIKLRQSLPPNHDHVLY